MRANCDNETNTRFDCQIRYKLFCRMETRFEYAGRGCKFNWLTRAFIEILIFDFVFIFRPAMAHYCCICCPWWTHRKAFTIKSILRPRIYVATVPNYSSKRRSHRWHWTCTWNCRFTCQSRAYVAWICIRWWSQRKVNAFCEYDGMVRRNGISHWIWSESLSA